MKVDLVAQGGPNRFSLSAALKPHVADGRFDRLDVAVAYATLPGVRALKRVLGEWPPLTRWVVGLDDAITQPDAIQYLAELAGAELKLARLSPKRRFHPKLYCFWSSLADDRCVTALGSGNMTQNGLQHNGEAATILRAETKADAEEAKAVWKEMWALGKDWAKFDLAAYQASHSRARVARKMVAGAADAPPEPDPNASVDDIIPETKTSERVIATCVARIAAGSADGICTFDRAREFIPRMIALTRDDLALSISQPNNAKWVQRLRNIQSNSGGGSESTNFIARGLLVHIPDRGYRITSAGRAFVEAQGL